MAHQQESFHLFSSRQSLSYFLSHMAKWGHPKVAQSQLSPKLCGPPKKPSMAAMPGFKYQRQFSSATPFPTPPTISYTCQHSCILLALLGCHSESGEAWAHGVETIICKLSRRHYNQGELPPSYIMGWSHSHLPGSEHGHSYLTFLWNQLKVIDMLNGCSRGYMQKCCYSKQYSMALLHSSHSPDQTCGGEDILNIYIFLIFPEHPEFWTPLQIPIWAPLLGCTLLYFLADLPSV